jgi:hypothetical protein
MKQLDPMAERGPQDLRTHYSSSQQSLNDFPHGLQPMEVCLGHTIAPVGSEDEAATCEHMERCVGIVPQKELYFPPPNWWVGHREVKVRINSRPELDQDVYTAQSYYFCVRAML